MHGIQVDGGEKNQKTNNLKYSSEHLNIFKIFKETSPKLWFRDFIWHEHWAITHVRSRNIAGDRFLYSA